MRHYKYYWRWRSVIQALAGGVSPRVIPRKHKAQAQRYHHLYSIICGTSPINSL